MSSDREDIVFICGTSRCLRVNDMLIPHVTFPVCRRVYTSVMLQNTLRSGVVDCTNTNKEYQVPSKFFVKLRVKDRIESEKRSTNELLVSVPKHPLTRLDTPVVVACH